MQIKNHDRIFNWRSLFVISYLISYFYVFMEWLFFVTKPSFMDQMSVISKLLVLIVTGGGFGLLVILLLLLFALFDILNAKLLRMNAFHISVLLPSFILAFLILVLVDNFTYTVFEFGVVSSRSIWRVIYAFGFLVLLFQITKWLLSYISTLKQRSFHSLVILASSLLFLSTIMIFWQFGRLSPEVSILGTDPKKLPNILIVGSDGINAENMSLYGYQKDTTPFLVSKIDEFLIAENAFTNAHSTTISTTSILTGKYPTDIKLVEGTGILQGEDSYQHLPGILHNLDYYSVQFGIPQYVDANMINMLDGFDVVNQYSYNQNLIFTLARRLGLNDAAYFLSIIFERASDRFFHIFFIGEMKNPFKIVTGNNGNLEQNDQDIIDQIINLVQTTETPVFVHTHLMGTHGSQVLPSYDSFPSDSDEVQDWITVHYDNAILSFDSYIGQMYDQLAASGELDNTILVIYTDHNLLYHTNQRIPLLIRFPHGKWAGKVNSNVQNLDIAPTILDFLDIAQPEWMSGLSFLRNEIPQKRLIQSGLGNQINIVECDKWYTFSVVDGTWQTGEVHGHNSSCFQNKSLTKADLPPEIVDYLATKDVNIRETADPETDDLIFYTYSKIASILLRKKYGPDYFPPPAQGIFNDVAVSDSDAPWIEQIYREGIIEPCMSNPLSYCPDKVVTRGEIAVFLLKTAEGSNYTPSDAKGIFTDVPVSSPYAPWVEELYNRHVTQGCSTSPLSFCASQPILSEHLIIFLDKIFSRLS